jgi:hypothetical protein
MAAANQNATNAAADNANRMAEEATKRFEENTERMKEFNSAVAESTKAGSRTVVDNYEKAAKSFFEMQRQIAGTSQNEWMKNTANTQIQFSEEVTNAWVKAARELLK